MTDFGWIDAAIILREAKGYRHWAPALYGAARAHEKTTDQMDAVVRRIREAEHQQRAHRKEQSANS